MISSSLQKLQTLIKKLRNPKDGDPWLAAQNFSNTIPLTIEECYELADSIEKNNSDDIIDELSDLLLHIVLYAEIASELKLFDLEKIAEVALEKQLRRRVVFDNNSERSPEKALAQWEKNKKKERAHKSNPYVFDEISNKLPPIQRSKKIQDYAAKVGFDWQTHEPIFDKLQEEIKELQDEISQHENQENITLEFGDILFCLINLARHLNIDTETALRKSNDKFEKRFHELEDMAKQQGKKLEDFTSAELDVMWNIIKNQNIKNL